MTPDHSTPQDISLELLVLSCCLYCRDSREISMTSLTMDDFNSPQYRELFSYMKGLFQKKVLFDENEIFNEIEVNGNKLVKEAYAGLYDQKLSPDYAIECVTQLKSVSRKRGFFNFCKQGLTEFSGKKSIDQRKYSSWVRRIQDFNCSFDATSQAKTLKEAIDLAYENPDRSFMEDVAIRQEKKLKGEPVECGIPTGFKEIDEIFGGFQEGHLTVIGARPGIGKTTLMCNIMLNIMKSSDVSIGVFSLEMPRYEIVQKLICTYSDINAKDLLAGRVTGAEFQVLNVNTKELSKKSVKIDDTGRLNLDLMESRAEMWVKDSGMKVLFIDYLQIISAGKFNNKYEEITHISQRLKMMAKNLKITVVSLAQLNRGSEKNETPKVSDLRDSGSIEQDSDEIFLLSTPSETDIYNKAGQLEVNLAKNRFGPTGKASLNFEKTLGKLSNLGSLNENSEFSSFT